MPKERRTRSVSFEGRSRASPYPCNSPRGSHKHSSSSSRKPHEIDVAAAKDMKKWDEVRCPVCMEHPHNAVLLLCASHGKGCQPFMCNTSYRHSNCLDQYRKAISGSSSLPEIEVGKQQQELSCPFCRGLVTGWTVVDPARRYMNTKARSCATESCGFNGTYGELRKHARTEHPSVRPSEADPERQRNWRRMEQQRDLGDLLSTMQSAMGGENGGLRILEDDEELESNFLMPPITFLFVFRVRSAGGANLGAARTLLASSRSPSRGSSRSRRRRRSILWGETFSEPEIFAEPESAGRFDRDGDGDGDDDEDANQDGGSEEAHGDSGRGQGRSRRQLRLMENDSDDAAADDFNDNFL